MTADDVRRALELRHPEEQGEWVMLHEALGIDTLAIRCWGGRLGHRRLAYEIKVSRSDFRRELERPAKRALAFETSHGYYFAMPWLLAQQVRDEVPLGLGLVGVLERGGQLVARDVIRAKILPPRALTDDEVARLVRHRAHPPALRNALLERQERNAEIRKLRNQRDVALEAAVELALPLAAVGARVAPKWSEAAHVTVRAAPRLERGRWIVPLRDDWGREYEDELGKLLSGGYRFRAPEEAAAA